MNEVIVLMGVILGFGVEVLRDIVVCSDKFIIVGVCNFECIELEMGVWVRVLFLDFELMESVE